MEDVTIVIQGRISEDCFQFYSEQYSDIKIIFSTWNNHKLDTKKFSDNHILVTQNLPQIRGPQNQYLQILSSSTGINLVDTKYVIKLRGDEYFSNLEYILDEVKKTPNKLHTSPIWFRHWSFREYHASDHIIAGTKENMKLMFDTAKYNFNNSIIKHWEPEIMLTRSYIMAKEGDRYDTVDGRILMKDNFSIFKIKPLEPYKIIANVFKRVWLGGFVPERNYCISDINKLFSDKETAYEV